MCLTWYITIDSEIGFVTLLTQAVRENDVDTVEKWISFKKHRVFRYQYDGSWFDKVDEYDKCFNAVHNAVITNNVKILELLYNAGAGKILVFGIHNLVCKRGLISFPIAHIL